MVLAIEYSITFGNRLLERLSPSSIETPDL